MILVCGASGTTGSATVASLLDAGAPVRALTRDPAAYAAPDGVEVVAGSFDDAASLAAALDGADAAYLVVNECEAGLGHRLAFVASARAAGLRRLVYLSAFGADEERTDVRFASHHGEVEAALRDSGIAWTCLRPNNFLQNFLGQAGAIQYQSTIYSPMSAQARVSHVDARDIGAMAAAALTQEGHAGRAYTLTGPAAVTDAEVASAIGAAIGREVGCTQVPVEAATGAMLEAGAHPYMVGLLPELWSFYETGAGAAVSGDVERVLGRPARGVTDFARDHGAAFGG